MGRFPHVQVQPSWKLTLYPILCLQFRIKASGVRKRPKARQSHPALTFGPSSVHGTFRSWNIL